MSDFPKSMTKKDHLGRTLVHEALDQKDFDAHFEVGYRPEYTHQKFPMAVHGPRGTGKTVNDEAELKAAKAEGFSEKPVTDDPEAA